MDDQAGERVVIDHILSFLRERRDRNAFERGGAVLGGMVADLLQNVAKFADRNPEALAQVVEALGRRFAGLETVEKASGCVDVDQMERFLAAWADHQSAGFEASRAECERLAATYGITAPPFAAQPSEEGLAGWRRLHDFLIDSDVTISDEPLGDQVIVHIKTLLARISYLEAQVKAS